MKNFKNLIIWNNGMKITKSTYKLCNQLPDKERYGLISQMTRAAVSIPANIAEGSSCSTNKHYRQYINTALGSSYELETLLLITRDTQEIDPSVIDPIIDLTIEEQRMLSAFLRKLN